MEFELLDRDYNQWSNKNIKTDLQIPQRKEVVFTYLDGQGQKLGIK